MAIRKKIDHSNKPKYNSKVEKQARQLANKTARQKRELAQMTVDRMKRTAQQTDEEHERLGSTFRLSDEDYAAVLANKDRLKESMNYGPDGGKQKAMRRKEIIYIIQSKVTGEVQELKFRDMFAAGKYFIGNRFEVIRYEEFKALSHGYKDDILNPEKSAKAKRDMLDTEAQDARLMKAEAKNKLDQLDTDYHSDMTIEQRTQVAFNRAEAEEYGVDLNY